MAVRFSEFMNRFKFKNRLIIFMALIIVLPIVALNSVFYSAYVKFYNKQIEESYNFMCRDSYTNLNYKLDLYSDIVDKTAFNKNIIKSIMKMDESNMMKNYQSSQTIDGEIENIVFGNSMEEVYQLLVYPLNPKIMVMGKYMSSYTNISHEEWLNNMQNKSKAVFFGEKMGNEVLSLVQVMYHIDEMTNKTTPIALVKADINLDTVLKNTISDTNQGMEIEITQNNKAVYYYNPINEKKPKKDVLAAEKLLQGEKIGINYHLDRSSEKHMRRIIFLISILLVVLPTALLVLAVIRFSENTNKRMEVICGKIKKIQNGDFDISKSLEGNDEFADIDGRLEEMAAELEQIINERYIMENERKNAQLMALQMQINPHFVYNTLETINSIAKQAGSRDISIISQRMGEILRYNINNNDCKFVYLYQELDNVKCYLSIQEIRFGDRLNVFYDIPEELSHYIVLKFTLQPVIENAIKYAVQDAAESSMIAITAKIDDGDLLICVQDDGHGIPEEKLTEIRQSLKNGNTSNKIGLKNVHSRIQITYGKKYGVEIFSKLNKGTSIHLRFPLREETESI